MCSTSIHIHTHWLPDWESRGCCAWQLAQVRKGNNLKSVSDRIDKFQYIYIYMYVYAKYNNHDHNNNANNHTYIHIIDDNNQLISGSYC